MFALEVLVVIVVLLLIVMLVFDIIILLLLALFMHHNGKNDAFLSVTMAILAPQKNNHYNNAINKNNKMPQTN